MFEAYRMMQDVNDEGRLSLHTKEAATAINRLNGKDMSWEAYDVIIDAIIALDSKFGPPEHEANPHGYGPHKWTCPACVADAKAREEYRRTHNPHRPGTKVHDKWDRDRAAVDWAMDMRGETYWSM